MLEVTIPQGALWRMSWPVFTPSGEPVTDLRDWQIRATARPHPDSGTTLHEWAFPGPGDSANVEVFRAEARPPSQPVTGAAVDTDWFRLIVRPADSIPWLWTYGIAHVELERSPDEIARPVELSITVSRETTR